MPFWNESEKVRNSLKEQGQQNLMTSERRRMELQSDMLTFQRDQRLNRAVRLQWRWQELSERERRAQQQNKQLLQEFDRAQDTLRDMVARTAAMNTIRVEYEKYLDENYHRWQQELKEQTLSAQRKRMEQHLQESIRRMEEKSVTGSPICAHAPLSQAQVPQTQNGQQNCSSHSVPSSWLTHTRYQLASPHTMLSFDPKRTQVSHHTPESFPPPPHFHPFHPPQPFQYYKPFSFPIHPQTVTQQGSTMWAPQGEDPLDWTGRVSYFPSNTQFGYQSSMAGPSMSDPQGRAVGEDVRVEKEVKEGLPVARNEGESSDEQRPSGNDQSHELDIQPVRLSSGHGESSDCSRASGRASGENGRRTRRKKKEKQEGRVKLSSADREETCLSCSVRSSGKSLVGPDAEASACATSEAHSSEGDDAMSGGASTRSQQTAGLSAKEPKRTREKAKRKEEETGSPVEEPQSRIEESPVESPIPVRESESHREESQNLGGESGSVSVKVPGCEEEVEGTEGEQESLGEEGEGEEEAEEEEAGQGAKDEKEEDEEASAGRESAEEEEEADQEAEELSNEADRKEERESDDSLILSKEHRPAENQLILAEEEDAMAGDDNPGDDDHGDGDDDHSDDGHGDDGHGEDARLEKGYSWSGDPTNAFQDEHDEIESLLAPRVETEKKLEKEQIDNKSKAKAGYLNSSSKEENLKENTVASPAAQNTESDDEFDHFYD